MNCFAPVSKSSPSTIPTCLDPMNEELLEMTINTEQLGQIFNRPVYNMKDILACSEQESAYPADLWSNLVFLQVDTIAFRDRRDIRKALGQFYGVLHAMQTRFWYIIKSDSSEGVIKLYLGIISQENTTAQELTHSLLGILPGCQVPRGLSHYQNQELLRDLSNYSNSGLVTGVPTCHIAWEKRDQYQEEEKARTGIERIIDSLAGEDFALSILCEPLSIPELREFRSAVADLHNVVKPLAKYHTNITEGTSEGGSLSVNLTVSQGSSRSESAGGNHSKAEAQGDTTTNGTSRVMKDGSVFRRIGKTIGAFWDGGRQVEFDDQKNEKDFSLSEKKTKKPSKIAKIKHEYSQGYDEGSRSGGTAEFSRSEQKSYNKSVTTTDGASWQATDTATKSTGRGRTQTINISETQTLGINREVSNMELNALSEQLGKLHKRLMNAEGQGMWKTCILFHANQPTTLQRAAYAGISIWSGEESSYDPMRCIPLKKSNNYQRNQLQLLDLNFTVGTKLGRESVHAFGSAYSNLYTCLTHDELAHIADFPHWDLPGITVQRLVEYARSSPKSKPGIPTIELGGLIDRTVNRKADVYDMISAVRLGYDQLNKHCFVCGVTGSGKSTTMRRLLTEVALHEERPIHFMVLEPVKTEYRILEQEEGIKLVRFSLGRRDGKPFALNPFSFPKGVELFSHLDFLKAVFNALLGSYSSMPFLLEALLCNVYKAKGWDLDTGNNMAMERELASCKRFGEHWKIREKYMPLIGEMAAEVDPVLNDFFGEDKSDYRISLRGALRARLNSLCSSLKGQLLNRTEMQDFGDLLHQNVLFELEAFSDNDEKSFIMALLLGRIYEHRQVEYQNGKAPQNTLRHIVVLEEAHRLLAKAEGKGELQANPRSKSVEIFSDMLAEVRAYGQGMIIVDQIPSKLTPEVMKNTEVKIAHRLLSKDDRETVGATMNLSKDQIDDLARHDAGEATMYFGNLSNALHVKIKEK